MDAKAGYIALGAIVGVGLLAAIPISTIEPTPPKSFAYSTPTLPPRITTAAGASGYAAPPRTTTTAETTTTRATSTEVDISPSTSGETGGYTVTVPAGARTSGPCVPSSPTAVLVMTQGRAYSGVICLRSEYEVAQIAVKAPGFSGDNSLVPILETYGTLSGSHDPVYRLRSLRTACMPRTVAESLNRGCVIYP